VSYDLGFPGYTPDSSVVHSNKTQDPKLTESPIESQSKIDSQITRPKRVSWFPSKFKYYNLNQLFQTFVLIYLENTDEIPLTAFAALASSYYSDIFLSYIL